MADVHYLREAAMRLVTWKRVLLGSGFGSVALAARGTVELLRATYGSPESIGTLVNDQLATFLTTRLCLPKKGFIDVGAHIGSIISQVAHYDASIKLYAVEPIPEKISILRRMFPTIELHQCALGESDGEITFYVNIKRSAYSSLAKPANDLNTVEINVPLRKLDSIIASDDIDVLKIDVEGAELGVLRGGDKLIARSRPLIMFESAPTAYDELGCTKGPLWEWLHEREFDIVVPNRVAHDGPGLNLEGFVEAHFYPFRTINYFAIPKERRLEIRDRARSLLYP
jgi:FkbM family methyltransferase